MKTKVIKLYDYKRSIIPEEYRKWRVLDEEIEQSLDKYSLDNAFDEKVDQVQMGDSVKCHSTSKEERWNREVLLLYPGKGLCDEKLECSCVGMKLKESRSIDFDNGKITITIDEIVRRTPMQINDKLIEKLGIKGVSTILEYNKWYREKHEEENRRNSSYRIADFFIGELAEHSEMAVDEEEKMIWIGRRGRYMYDVLVAAGFDPKIPSEGFEILTEEQAIKKLEGQQEIFFRPYVICMYFVENYCQKSMEEVIGEGMQRIAKELDLSIEVIRQQNPEEIKLRVITEKTMEILLPYANKCLED